MTETKKQEDSPMRSPYSPDRPGYYRRHWMGKTCFFQYQSGPPTLGQASNSRGKRPAEDDGGDSHSAGPKWKRTRKDDDEEAGFAMDAGPGDHAGKRPYNAHAWENAMKQIDDRREALPDRETSDDEDEFDIHRLVLEDGDPSTPPFSPLRKRLIPLSTRGLSQFWPSSFPKNSESNTLCSSQKIGLPSLLS